MKGEKSLMATGRLRGVIFDMDGVLIDSHGAHRNAWKAFLKTVNRSVSESDLDFILEGRKRADILRHFLGPLTAEELEHFGRQKDEFFQRMTAEVQTVAGVLEFLDELARLGIRAGIATSGSRLRTHLTLDRLHLRHHFSAIITGDDVPNGKPDPQIYRVASKALQLDPGSLIAIEDAVSGVQAATGAGIACVGLVGNEVAQYAMAAAGAKYFISNFIGLSVVDLMRVPGQDQLSDVAGDHAGGLSPDCSIL